MRVVILLIVLAASATAEALPLAGLERVEWTSSRADLVRLFGGQLDRRATTRNVVVGTVSVEGAARWIELHFERRRLVAVYVALDAETSKHLARRFARTLEPLPLRPAHHPTWRDRSTYVTLESTMGCHSMHAGLWLRRRR